MSVVPEVVLGGSVQLQLWLLLMVLGLLLLKPEEGLNFPELVPFAIAPEAMVSPDW